MLYDLQMILHIGCRTSYVFFTSELAPLRFQDITEDNFESILRRFAVVQIMSRMFEKSQLDGVDYDPDTRGIFTRDPEVDTFYVSGPALAAGLKIQSGFEDTYDKDACFQLIEKYTRGGGDLGVGVRFMRECCGLKPLDEPSLLEHPQDDGADTAAEEPPPVQLHLEPPRGREDPDEQQSRVDVSVISVTLQCVSFLLDKHLDGLTPSYLAQCKLKNARDAATKKQQLWASFQKSSFWRKPKHSIGKASETLFPIIKTVKPFGALFAPPTSLGSSDDVLRSYEHIPATEIATTLREQYDMEPLRVWHGHLKVVKCNSQLLVSTLLAEAKRLKSRRLGFWDPEGSDLLQARAEKLRGSERCMDYYVERMIACQSDPGAKRRKLAQKQSSTTKVETREVEYRYKKDWRDRRYATSPHAAQSMSRELQALILRDTVDIDIKNSIFTCLHQAMDRLSVLHQQEFKGPLDTLRALATDRAAFCQSELGVGDSDGKRLVHSLVNGAALPPELKDSAGALKLRTLARFLRWLSTSLMPRQFEAISAEKASDKGWADATCSSTFYFALEDHILSSIVKAIRAKPTAHLSLHFDGVRVDKARVLVDGGDPQHFCRTLEAAVKEDTGYDIALAVKEHHTLMQRLKLMHLETAVTVEPHDHLLLKDGNCIPLGLATALLGLSSVVQAMTEAGQGSDYPVPSGLRSYRETAALLGCTLSPVVLLKDLRPGQWLVHTTMLGKPHCVGLVIEADDCAYVHSGGTSYKTTLHEIRASVDASVDKKNIVFFRINADTDASYLAPLLDLQAGVADHLFDCDMDKVIADMPFLEESPPLEDDDEGCVHVESALKQLLATEVKCMLKTLTCKRTALDIRGSRDAMICPFCPKREFRELRKRGMGRLVQHIRKEHHGVDADSAAAKDFVASGSKQFQLVRALYDQQIAAHGTPSDLLQKSAELIRTWIDESNAVPERMSVETAVDRKLSLCLTGDGPKFLSTALAKTSGSYRSVGYFFYDNSFATIFFSEMVRHKGKAKAIATSLMSFFITKGCPVVFLLPRKASTVYLKIMEDIMGSPVVQARRTELLAECISHQEFVHISMDATVRMAMRIKGQANYREPKAVRDSYIVPNLAEI